MSSATHATEVMLRPPGDDTEDRDDLLRLHCNESPFGAPRAALRAAYAELSARHASYPDNECTALRARLGIALGVEPEMVVAGNGADELIQLLALALVPSGGRVAVTEATFPGYAASAATAGLAVRRVPMVDDRVSAPGVVRELLDGAAVAFVCNPHNPSGTRLPGPAVAEILDAADAAGSIAVFDEAYVEFAADGRDVVLDAVRAGRRTLLLRTFSKAWGLAGLRLGYAAGHPELIGRIRRARASMPFSVNRIVQRAAIAALDDPGHLVEVRRRTSAARERLTGHLTALGLPYVPSEANFVLVKVGGDSAALADELLRRFGIRVRDLTPLGRAGCLRVTVGTEDQMDRFRDALSAVRAGVTRPESERV